MLLGVSTVNLICIKQSGKFKQDTRGFQAVPTSPQDPDLLRRLVLASVTVDCVSPKWSGGSSCLPDTFLSQEAPTGKTGQMDLLIVLTAIQPIDR